MGRFVEVAERMGNAEAIYRNRPDLVQPREIIDSTTGARRPETPEEAIIRAVRGIKAGEAIELDHRTLGDHANRLAVPTTEQINVTLNLSNPQLGKIGAEGSAQQIEAMRNTMKHLLTPGTVLSPGQFEQLARIEEYLDQSPNWQKI
jgi:hypothetical protein